MGSCGFYDNRKGFKYDEKSIPPADQNLYVDKLSIDDNRNIKKLYAIMDLGRKKESIDTLLVNMEVGYKKL